MFDFKNDYNIDDFQKVANILKTKSLIEVIETLDLVMKKAYTVLNYPVNCCDFATEFAGFIFVCLKYDVLYLSAYYSLTDHSFLKVNDEYIDFTIEQFHDC